MRPLSGTSFVILLLFFAGFFSHVLYQRWNPPTAETQLSMPGNQSWPAPASREPQSYRVSFAPLPLPSAAEETNVETPLVVAREVEKIRALTGKQARIRGRVFRVGHSAKSNTYFLNFGPSREALTAVIFSSAVELFEKNKQAPKNFENKDVEIIGAIKDHPQYGLEIVVENPKQIKIIN
jgi:hypothetical protein